MIEPGFWAGRRVLVTGHTGFKGAWLTLWLEQLGALVSGFADGVPSQPSLYEAARVAASVNSVTGDVRDLAAVRQAVESYRPEILFHLAAQSLVRESFAAPVDTYETNVMGTVNVLEAARSCESLRVVVIVTSDKCYENREWVWPYREHEAMGGHDPYSSSKGCAELVTAAYRRSFFGVAGGHPAAVASARAGNVIGGGDWARDRLVPDLVRGALVRERVAIRSPNALRPWQHVLNPLSGYLLLAQTLWDSVEHAEGWNFGPAADDVRPVSWIADRIAASWGGELEWFDDSAGEHPHEAQQLNVDSSKAAARLGWRPRWSLAAALESIVEWSRRHAAGEDARELTLEQIRRYQEGDQPLLPSPLR